MCSLVLVKSWISKQNDLIRSMLSVPSFACGPSVLCVVLIIVYDLQLVTTLCRQLTEIWTRTPVTSSCVNSALAHLVSLSPPTFWPVVLMSSRFPWSSTTTYPPSLRTTSTVLVVVDDLDARVWPSILSPRMMSACSKISKGSTTL